VNFLGYHARDFPVRAAVTVSAPIDLTAAAERIMAPRNRFYHRYLLDRMKLDWAGLMRNRHERIALARIATIREFDDRLVAPPNGFGTADNYYAECSATRVLGDLTTPTLLIHAADDPWIPAAGYRAVDGSANPALTHLMPERGGHVGFHQRGDPPTWHDVCIGRFFGVLPG